MAEWGSVWLIPFTAAMLAYTAMFSAYGIGISNGHIPKFVPFISDGGAFPPESCIFAQFMNMAALFLLLTVYIRHRQIVEYYGNRLRRDDLWWRRISFSLAVLGTISSIAVTAVAAFSATDSMTMHGISAMTCFFTGTAYIWGQLVLSFMLMPRMASPATNWSRVVIAVISTGGLIIHEVALHSRAFLEDGVEPLSWNDYSPRFLDPDSPYYVQHTVAAIAEWVMAIFFFLFVLSFSIELRATYVRFPKVFFRKTRIRGEANEGLAPEHY